MRPYWLEKIKELVMEKLIIDPYISLGEEREIY